MAKLIILFFASLIYVQCLIYQEDQKELNLTFKQMQNEIVGKKGTAMASFAQNPDTYDIVDIKKEPCFDSLVSNGNDVYKVKCGLWSKELSREVIIFCNIDNNIPSGDYYILLNETQSFTYKDYVVTLQNCDNVKFKKLEEDIIDLYSDCQKIQIKEEIDSYELKFNIVSYNEQPIFLNLNMPLDNCRADNNILICTIAKNDLLAYFTPTDTEAIVGSINNKNNITYFPLVPKIVINHKDYPKKDICVGIKKLLSNTNFRGAYIAYETNVTEVSNFYNFGNSQFKLTFINKEKEEEKEKEVKTQCSFVKYEINPLFLLCKIEDEGKYWLKEIKEEIIVDENNIQYNYKIQPVKLEEPIIIKGDGRFIYWSYPKVLDFTKTKDSLYVQYGSLDHPEYLKGLTFNENEKDLECKIINELLKCEVPKSHFKGKTDGFYFLMHDLTNENKIISYEVQPIQILLDDPETDSDSDQHTDSKGNIASLSTYYLIFLTLLFI